MADVVTIKEAVQRAKADGLPVTEYTLRHWLKSGTIPTRTIGKKVLLYYPNLTKYVRCEDVAESAPATVADAPGIRRADL